MANFRHESDVRLQLLKAARHVWIDGDTKRQTKMMDGGPRVDEVQQQPTRKLEQDIRIDGKTR